jgi:aminoglycoside phosphotransferase (APT) family kinase protein
MPDLLPAGVPEAHREKLAAALANAFGSGEVSSVLAFTGGASGAMTYRVEAGDGAYLLRGETIAGPMRNPNQYECMQRAADAGIEPPIRYVDADAGVVVIRWIDQRPVTGFAGGPVALASAGGQLLARLHETAPFPSRGDHLQNLAGLLGFVVSSGRVAPGLLDRHGEAFEQIRAAYPWRPDTHVSCHNDPNQFNLLYDGDRLWLVDWETANRNDPMIDLATMCTHLGPTVELRDEVLAAWRGAPVDELLRSKVVLAENLVRLFAGCILLLIVQDPATPSHTDLTAMSPVEFGERIERGDLVAGQPATTLAFAKMSLAGFLEAMETPEVSRALEVAAAG